MCGKLTNEERADEQGVESKLYSGISQWGGSWQCDAELTHLNSPKPESGLYSRRVCAVCFKGADHQRCRRERFEADSGQDTFVTHLIPSAACVCFVFVR